MTLEDVGVETFNLLVNWLYTQKVEHAEKKIEHVELYELCKLWSLGERFLMPKLQNDAMRVMVTRDCAGEYSEEPTEYAYNAYAEDAKSPLKRIFVLRAVSGMRTAAKAKVSKSEKSSFSLSQFLGGVGQPAFQILRRILNTDTHL